MKRHIFEKENVYIQRLEESGCRWVIRQMFGGKILGWVIATDANGALQEYLNDEVFK